MNKRMMMMMVLMQKRKNSEFFLFFESAFCCCCCCSWSYLLEVMALLIGFNIITHGHVRMDCLFYNKL